MKLFLNNVLKGLLVSLLVITLGGFLYIDISKPEKMNLQLISSSIVNQVGTESKNLKESQKGKENNENKVLVDTDKESVKEEKEENKIEDKEVVESSDKATEVEVSEQEEQPKIEEKTPEIKVEEKKEEIKEVEKPKEEEIETPKEEVSEPSKEEAPQNDQNSNNQSSNDNQNNQVTPKGSYAPNMAAVQAATVKNTYVGLMTAYGPDCVGCGGMVAHGEYVGGGNIYYNDKTFGSIRIVAGDRSLGFGTIIRIKGISAEPIIAVMLDTGGAIGFNKGTYFDLLYESEAAASSFGRPKATFEILRYGF